jgi:hypothetical protein
MRNQGAAAALAYAFCFLLWKTSLSSRRGIARRVLVLCSISGENVYKNYKKIHVAVAAQAAIHLLAHLAAQAQSIR